MNCIICGTGPSRKKLRKGDTEILQCLSCGLEFWVPDESFRAESIYDSAYFDGADSAEGYDDYKNLEGSLRATFMRRMMRIPKPPGEARLLDIGAAFGFAVSEAERIGWRACGLEVSQSAAAQAAGILPGRILVANALQLPFADDSFHAVTLWDVLEHLSSPQTAIAEIARVLRPGGRLVLSTGDVGSLVARMSGARWHLYTLPEHLFFHTRKSLRILLEDNGFHIESMRAESAFYTLGYLVERLRKSLLGRTSTKSANWPGAQVSLPVNLFDIVSVQATLRTEA
jgi:SAM-dependent methyltransferase